MQLSNPPSGCGFSCCQSRVLLEYVEVLSSTFRYLQEFKSPLTVFFAYLDVVKTEKPLYQ